MKTSYPRDQGAKGIKVQSVLIPPWSFGVEVSWNVWRSENLEKPEAKETAINGSHVVLGTKAMRIPRIPWSQFYLDRLVPRSDGI